MFAPQPAPASMTNQLIQILEKTVSPDKNELTMANSFLEEAARSNLPEFLKALSDLLVQTQYSNVARMAAGLQLKNHLTSKDPNIKREYTERWLQFPADIRDHIKTNILGALGTEKTRPSSAAQCVAAVAIAELPGGHWHTLIETLLGKVANEGSQEMEREATLEAIGYICQDIPAEVLKGRSNSILTAIIHGMRKAEMSNHVRLAATNALLNSLEFTKNNFESTPERNYIMEVVCEATQSTDTQICVAALQCLVKIMSLYYQHMEMYMGQALFPITMEAMKSDNMLISLQGIEFWSNVCDEEVDLEIERQEAQENGETPTRVSRHYARGALHFLAPILMDKLCSQEEFDDEDDWNPSKAASVCLMLMATCCETEIVPHVMPFIKDNIKSENWKYRDAALTVFGSILGGLDENTLKHLVEEAMGLLVELMYDPNATVRDTAAWTFGRICEIIPQSVIESPLFPKILEALLRGLKEVPRLAANVCWALSSLAEAAYDAAPRMNDLDKPKTFILSKYYHFIIECLLETTERLDGNQANLRSAAYEALMEIIKNSPADCYGTVQKTTMVILTRLNNVLQMESHHLAANNTDVQQFSEVQSHLCGALQSLLRKVSREDAPQISDAIMNALITIFASNAQMRKGAVLEDALSVVIALAELIEDDFIKYMDAFKPYLYMSLKNHQEYEVCCTAVGLTGDICRGMKTKVLPYCDELMTLLLENLSNPNLHRSVKPQILSVFGDVAISIGPEFQKYLPIVLQMLGQATAVHIDDSDYDMIDYLNELRESVLESYTGIVQGLTGADSQPMPEVQAMESQVPHILKFIVMIAEDKNITDTIVAAAAGVVGDMCKAFGAKLLPLLENTSITKLLQEGRKSKMERTKVSAFYAQKEILKLQKQQLLQQQLMANQMNAPVANIC